MSKEKKEKEVNIKFGIGAAPIIAVPHRKIDLTVETVQGQEKTVKSLFEDYVLGRLDPRQLGGGDYDDDDSDEVDPLNNFGVTLEEASRIGDAGRHAAKEIETQRKTVANASTDKQQEKEGKEAKSGEPKE